MSIYWQFVLTLLGIPVLFFAALQFSQPSIAAAIVAAGVPLSFHTFRIFADKPHVAKLDENGTKLTIGDEKALPFIRVYVELENYGRRTAHQCYVKLNQDGDKTYTRWHLINQQYVDFHPTDERRAVIARLIPSKELIEELAEESEVDLIDPGKLMFQLGHSVRLRGHEFHVDCPIQVEQEQRVLERQDQEGTPDIFMGRQLRTGEDLEGVLEIAAEDYKETKNVDIDLEELVEEAEWREDRRGAHSDLAEEFEKLVD